MYYMYSNIWTYSYSENLLGLINSVPAYDEIFWILFTRHSLSVPGYSYWFLMYVERVAIDVISKMQTISHLFLRLLINSNVLNIGSLIYLYNAWVKLPFWNEYFIYSCVVFLNLVLGSINP